MAEKAQKRKVKRYTNIRSVSDLPRVWIKRCKVCNERFLTISVKGKAEYCKKCRSKQFEIRNKRHSGFNPVRATCKGCGEDYVKMAGNQKWCKECRRKRHYEAHKRWREKIREEKYWNQEV